MTAIPEGLFEFVIYAQRCCPTRKTTFLVRAKDEEDARDKGYDILYPNFRKLRGFWKQWKIVGVRKR